MMFTINSSLQFITVGDTFRLLALSMLGLFRFLKPLVLNPLMALFLPALTIACPFTLTLYVNLCLKNKYSFSLTKALFNFIIFTLLWYVVLYLAYIFLANNLDEHSSVDKLIAYIFYTFFVCFVMLTFILCSMQASLVCVQSPIKLALKAFIINLPATFILAILICVILYMVERIYATYKLEAMYNTYILKKDSFDPSYIFLIIRAYILHVFFSSIAIMYLKVYGVIKFSFNKK